MIRSKTGKIQELRDKWCYNQGSEVFQRHEDMVRAYFDVEMNLKIGELHETIVERLHDLDTAVSVIDNLLYMHEVDVDFDDYSGRSDVGMKSDVGLMWMFTVLTFRNIGDMMGYCEERRKTIDLR